MGLKRRFSVRWRLFLPLMLMMWVVIGAILWMQYRRETAYRTELINQQLTFINSRIIDAYDSDRDLLPFMQFLQEYFDGSMFDELRVTVYDRSGGMPYCFGEPLRPPMQGDNSKFAPQGLSRHSDESNPDVSGPGDDRLFYYIARKSNDGKMLVLTAMPLTVGISDALHADDFSFWVTVILAMVVVTLVAFASTSFLMRNLRVLHDFAQAVTTGQDDAVTRIDETKLGHDELGDISREIISLYRQRMDLMRKSEHEHSIAVHAIEEKGRLKRQLTNNINHELKTPVGVIRGYLETVLTSPDMDADMQRYFLQRAQDNVDRLCNLLNDVSTMARLEDGSGKIPLADLDIHDLAYTIFNDMQQAGTTGSMDFELDIPLGTQVLANNNLLTSAISNLIKNAAIHSRGTQMGLRLVNESDKFYTFAFWDNGTGIEPQHLPHIFERFYRIDAGRSRKSGGTGLGLPIVKNTIEALGGNMSVANRNAGGLEFTFTIRKCLWIQCFDVIACAD